MELSQISDMALLCHSSHVSMRGVRGTVKLRPRAKHTLKRVSYGSELTA
jgi:hypothetical protein